MDNENEGPPTAKRTDVGYKRPPVEHRFKPGQKPTRRKRRAERPLSGPKLLAKILGEERRVKQGRKFQWRTNGSLIIEVAFGLAEEGNSTVRRALADYLLVDDEPEVLDDQPRVEVDPDGPSGVFYYTRRVKV